MNIDDAPMPDIDFNALQEAAASNQDQASMDALWGAVYQLEKWNFVGRGEPDKVHAFVGMPDGRPFLMAFTDEKRTHTFAVSNKLEMPNGAIAVLGMDRDAAINYALQLEQQGVVGIYFNYGTHGFFAPMTNLIPMRDYFAGTTPE